MSAAPVDVLLAWVEDPAAGWSVGTFGAIAEFLRDTGEPAVTHRGDGWSSVVTDRGGLAVHAHPGMRPVAWERLAGTSWTHAVALCLPLAEARVPGRTTVTELGPDGAALRGTDRDAVLFDLGVGAPHLEACVRTADPELLAVLRAAEGQPVFGPGPLAGALVGASPHRVFRTALARAEVYSAIPPPGGTSPDGPHTHLLPRLLAHGRTHAATDPVPDGWVPCAAVHPPHPTRAVDGRGVTVDVERSQMFRAVLERWGHPGEVAATIAVEDAFASSAVPPEWVLARETRTTTELLLRRQEEMAPDHPHLVRWRAAIPRVAQDEQDIPLTHDPAQPST